ncbi:3-hydroxyacyl-CoA dehydrogenase [groundwater metagenome]|uniref:3-hydroxyacyl-CoA dehydrogenase n=1 Tax=groundwater metagenome TaxID=717931 RepID=A0A098EFN7_9ZZZZ
MIFKCEKCNLVWYYPIKKCIYCKGEVKELKEEKYTIKGITEVFVPSKDNSQLPYYDILLEDENGNLHIKKSFKKYEIGDDIIKDKKEEYVKEKIGVIGTGVTGVGIAQVFVSSGFEVILKSRAQESLHHAIQKIEEELLRTMSVDEKDKIIKKIKITTNLDDLINTDIIIESVIEDLEVKKQLFKELDEILLDKTIIATNTSSLSIDELSASTIRPDRFIGMHFFNPVPKMYLVEVVRGEKTSDATINKITELSKQINKTPIITKNSPCFIVNRILMVYLNEAIWELYENVASAEDIDAASKLGLNHPMGPLALADLIGLDVVLAIIKSLYQRTNDKKYIPCPLIEEMVNKRKLGKKTMVGFYKY